MKLLAWHFGLFLAVLASWGCVGMLGALALDELADGDPQALRIDVDARTETATVAIYGTDPPFGPDFAAKVQGVALTRNGDRLVATTPRRRGYDLLLKPGFFGSYSFVVRAPKPLRSLKIEGERLVLRSEEDNLDFNYDLSVELVEAGIERLDGTHAEYDVIATPTGVEIPLVARRPFEACVHATERSEYHEQRRGTRFDGPVVVRVLLGCVTAKAD